ncbi:hypothetical protein BDZ45DRAFT_649189 [Acephala macrosclerotiorum]|nr:hypothetical protein BDZ45DRAFT_649189 [Acephala macrosclerotiorum]
MPYIAIQNLIPHAQISVAIAILIFCQNFSSATFLTIAQTIFSNGLKNSIPKHAPGANVEAVLQAGATSFRSVVMSDQVDGVLKAYSVSVGHVFYLICGACVDAFCFGWGMGGGKKNY